MSQAMADKPHAPTRKSDATKADFLHRRTSELVIALCGFIGSGVSEVAKTLKKLLDAYNYEPGAIEIIKISKFIRDSLARNASSSGMAPKKTAREIERLQDEGNRLCSHDGSHLIQLAIKEIVKKRNIGVKSADDVQTPRPRRHVTIIDSLKRPEEYALLRLVYGDMLYLLGVLAPKDIRISRLKGIGFTEADAEACVQRDRDEHREHGQKTSETLIHADFFLDNAGNVSSASDTSLKRFLELVFGSGRHTPTNDEYAMFCAWGAAMRSGCLSRQVGAAIMRDGVILATGRNDVPKNEGGLYCEDDDLNDQRCFKLHGHLCYSNRKKESFLSQFAEQLKNNGFKEENIKNAIASLEKTQMFKSITEYTRAVHAEMDAITSYARLGGSGIRGSTLYCTTLPCHHCAKLILAVGIKRVVFIEPYDKSLSYDLYRDSIAIDQSQNQEINKLHMEIFSGVAPKSYGRLFLYHDRKDSSGRLKSFNPREALPRSAPQVDRFIDYELKILDMIENLVDSDFNDQ